MAKKNISKKRFHSGIVKKSIRINQTRDKVWKKISNIVGLSEWVMDVKKTEYISKRKRGIGAIRKIRFNDGNEIEEHVVVWENKKYFSYLATSGLPLRVYHATISMRSNAKKSTTVTWQSYLNSKKMSKKEFNEFVDFMGKFYQASLKNLKVVLEK